MAVNPRVESTHLPYLTLRLAAGTYTLEVEALLDTGFDGDVAVPPRLWTSGEPPDQYLIWTLADGSEILAPAFIGTAHLGPFPESPVLITTLGDEPLLGRGVSDRFTLILDHGRRLIVEP